MDFQRILFLSKENTILSPMAEWIMKSILMDKSKEILSRGLVVLFEEPQNKKVTDLLTVHGIPCEEKLSREFSEEEVDEHTLILTMNFPEMEKLHSDLEVMEICQVPQAVIYPKEFGTKKDIADFQDSVFYLSADAPVEYSRANLEQICVQKEFIPKTKVVPNHATLLSLMDREDSAAIMDLWCQPIYDKKFKYVRLEASVPIVGVFRKNCAHAKIIRMLYETLAERYGEEVMIIIRK